VAALVALGILVSGVTVVRPDEVALVLRFGRLTGHTRADQVHGPGLLLALPYLIDEVVRVPVKRIQETRIDVLTGGRQPGGDDLDVTKEGYALTADHNIVQAEVVLKYQIVDPAVWALRISAPDALVRDTVVGALTRTLGEMAIDPVLGDRKKELLSRAQARAQARLDADGPWVRLVALELTSIRPPLAVAPVFDAVHSAFVERETLVGRARGYREQGLPKAAAEAQAAIRDAEAEATARLATARGEAAAFLAIQAEYHRNPAVVRQRLYREAMEQVFLAVGGRVLVPPGADGGRLLIPADGGLEPREGEPKEGAESAEPKEGPEGAEPRERTEGSR
jgi:membrane protease subunit HflK